MRRRDLVQALCRSTPDQDNIVAYPDHPFLVRGPDVLARDDEGLVAYFVYASGDPRPGLSAGRARTLLSRLALPKNTEFVLVCEPPTRELSDGDVELFDAIRYGVTTVQSHRSRLEPSGYAPRGIVAELRPFHMRRFGDAWAMRDGTGEDELVFTRDAVPERRAQGVPISYLGRNTVGRRHRLPPTIDLDNGILYAAPRTPLPTRSAVIRVIGQWISAAVNLDYSSNSDTLSAAVEALYSQDAYLPLHHARTGPVIEGVASDILKPYRAAAFAGFQMINDGV